MLTTDCAEPIADAFDLGPNPQLFGPVARGEVGQIWKLTTRTGVWAIKETFEPPSAIEAEYDAHLQEVVAAAGVNVPTVRRARGGDALEDVAGELIRVYSWVDLTDSDRAIDPEQVGQLLASIHRVVVHSGNPIHPWYTDPIGAARWDELIRDLREAEASFAEQIAEQRDELIALEALLRYPNRLQACHRDLFADNVLSTPDGDLCVIDWENSGLADPTQELAVVIFEYGRGQDDRSRLLYDAYVDGGGPGRLRDRADFSMLIAQLGHIGEIACRRWLDPRRTNQRDRNENRINEFLADRLTLDSIDTILAATQRSSAG
jgi:thiamine kinase-like enzyme